MKISIRVCSIVFAAAVSLVMPRALKAQDNVAIGKVATHSSGWNGPGQDIFPAANAIDGNLSNFAHTGPDDFSPSWQVDLGDFQDITYVVLYNRGDGCCQSRHRDLTVEIKDGIDDDAAVLFKSALINPENILGGGTELGPKFVTLDLKALTGGPVQGTVVRLSRTPDFDFSGTGGLGNSGEPYLLQPGEVEVYTGDCESLAGSCSSITVAGPTSGGPGVYTVTAAGAGDPIYYTVIADNGTDPPSVVGPLEESVIPVVLTPGTWTVSVKVGDSRLCPSEAPEALCSQQVIVKTCAEDPQDTTCDAMTVFSPHGGPFPGIYTATVTATDASLDEVLYTFKADNGVDPATTIGPQKGPSARFDLAVGNWTITSNVGDSTYCPPDDAPTAKCSEVVQVKALSDKQNVAPLGTTTQSSGYATAGEGQFPSSLAIDGNRTNFTHTGSADALATWEVDLLDLYAIEAIQMYNRSDCCQYRFRDITVTILDVDGQEVWKSDLLNEENQHPDGSGNPYSPARLTVSLLELTGKAVDGKIVRIERTADPDASGLGGGFSADDMNVLSLGEVEIFAAPTVLAAGVSRDLAKDTFSGNETVDVSLSVTAAAPNTPITVREAIPTGAEATGISDSGQVVAGAIEWDLGPVSGTKTLTYKIGPTATCVGSLAYGASSFTALGKKGLVKGETLLTRTIADSAIAPWQSIDIGTTGGAAEPIAAHDILVQAPGLGIKGTADEFRFVYIQMSGDFEFTARIDCMDDPTGTGQAGLMVRDTTDPFSAHAFVGLSSTPPAAGGAGTLKGTFRRQTLATRTSGPIPITLKDVDALPIYIKLKRTGTTIAFERSGDGAIFTEFATREVGMGTTQVDLKNDTLVGLAATAGSAALARYIFGAVSGPEFPTGGDKKLLRRGDADSNGSLDLTDPVAVLNYLFLAGVRPVCVDAADVDDTGLLDLTDAVYSLNYQFLAGPRPPAPGPDTCGEDTTPDEGGVDLGCEQTCQ